MPITARIASIVRTLTSGARLDADLDAELRAHVDLLTEEGIRAGLSPDGARRAALLEVGGVEQVKERVRDVRLGLWLETVWHDVRYVARSLRRTPWFTATVVVSLGVGIGLNTAIFSAIEAVLLRPLPYQGTGQDRGDRPDSRRPAHRGLARGLRRVAATGLLVREPGRVRLDARRRAARRSAR